MRTTPRRRSCHYRVSDGSCFFAHHHELYWNITGTDSDEPLHGVTAHIDLPCGGRGIRSVAYTGGSTARGTSGGSQSQSVENQPLARLSPGSAAVVGWDKGSSIRRARSKAVRFLRSNWLLFVPLRLRRNVLAMVVVRPRSEHRPITVQYDPPDKLRRVRPARSWITKPRCAISPRPRGLAVKGYMTIEQTDKSQMLGLSHSKSYTFD